MERSIRILLMLSRVFKWSVLALSLCVLVGWYYDIDLLKRLLIGSIFMNPITATLFLLISLSAIIELVTLNKLAFLIFNGFVIVVCSCKLVDYFIGLPFKIDHLIFGDFFNGNDKVYSMAPTTAILFILLSLAQVVSHFKKYFIYDFLMVAIFL